MRVQYNLFIDGARARRRENVQPLDQVDLSAIEADAASRPDESASQQQGLTTLQRAFNQLKREHRALLALRVEGYSPTEIQAMTGLKLNVVNARLHRARKRLAQLLRAEADAQVPDDRMEVRR